MNITATMVKELREATGAGMMDCKKALIECEGDAKKATEYLTIKGLAKAAKRSGRKASEGYIGTSRPEDGKSAVVVEVNCETDFVARTDNFRNFSQDLAAKLHKDNVDAASDDAALMALNWDGDTVESKCAKLNTGENVRVRRLARLDVHDNGYIGMYRHHDGKTGILVEVGCKSADTASKDAFRHFCQELAIHICGCNPMVVRREDLDQDTLADQKRILTETALEENKNSKSPKPEKIIEDKIIPGRLDKWLAEITLVDQKWMGDNNEASVAEQCAKLSKELGEEVSIRRFARIAVGEGASEGEEEAAE